MDEEFTAEQIKNLENDFKEYLADRDNILHDYHITINKILNELPESGSLIYGNEDGKVRMELHCSDGSVLYSWWANEDVIGYSLCGALSAMFGTEERIAFWSTCLAFGGDLRREFIGIVNRSIDIVSRVSEEWDICIS